MSSDGVEIESRDEEEEEGRRRTEGTGEVDPRPGVEKGGWSSERERMAARRNSSRAPVGPIKPYMAAKFLPNSLSLSLSLYPSLTPRNFLLRL